MRSSPATCCEKTFGTPKVVPPSSECPVVMFGSVRLEYARFGAVPPVSCGPTAQSQSPPPTVPSGYPRYVSAEPSCVTRHALQPAGTPVGAITNERPWLSVRMLGSPVPLECGSCRLVLNVGAVPIAPAGPVAAASASVAPAARARIVFFIAVFPPFSCRLPDGQSAGEQDAAVTASSVPGDPEHVAVGAVVDRDGCERDAAAVREPDALQRRALRPEPDRREPQRAGLHALLR